MGWSVRADRDDPAAHELCVYFGMLAGGRLGAFLAGLGFMLPGFVLMLALLWFYVSFGINSALFQSIFAGMQPAVAALIVGAVHRIGSHALRENPWLWGIAFLAVIAQLLRVNSETESSRLRVDRRVSCLADLNWIFGNADRAGFPGYSLHSNGDRLTAALLSSGLKSGLLTFGGAYTVIPFLQRDAVEVGGWMTNNQFLDGLALSGLLPAPPIIFSRFVGYIRGGHSVRSRSRSARRTLLSR